MKVILIVHDDDDDLHHVGQMKRWRRELSHIRRKKRCQPPPSGAL